MTEEEFAKLGQHLSRVEADVKKFAQIRGYTTVYFPSYSGHYPRINLLKLEHGYQYSISLRMEERPDDNQRYTSFFEEIPYLLMASIKGTKKEHKYFELYIYKPFNQLEKTFFRDLLQCDYRLEGYKNEEGEEPIGVATNYYESSYSYDCFKDLNATIAKFSKNFNYEYDYDLAEHNGIPKIKLFKKIDEVLFNIILRPEVGVGERFELSGEFPYTLRYSTSYYENNEDNNSFQCCYTDAIFYENKPYKEIAKSFYEDLVYCDNMIMSEDYECLEIEIAMDSENDEK